MKYIISTIVLTLLSFNLLFSQISILAPSSFPVDISNSPVTFNVSINDTNGWVNAANEFQVFIDGVSLSFDISAGDVNPGPFGSSTIALSFTVGVAGSGADLIISNSGIFSVTMGYQDANSSAIFNNEGSIVPVELIDFKVENLRSATNISWITANEQNNEGFELLRSSNGINFESIAKIEGAGNSDEELSYSYMDYTSNSEQAQIIYYQLKQIDYDGNVSYSDVVSVVLERIFDYENKLVYRRNTLELDIANYDALYLQYLISDMAGRVISSGKLSRQTEADGFIMNTHFVTTGQYIFSFNNGIEWVSERFFAQN